jgi:uncharacterized protein DUF3300
MRTLVAVVTAVGLTVGSLAISHGLVVYGSGPEAQSSKPAKSHTPEQLDKLLAPIALYPDSLLAQMLISAGNPGKVSALAEWMASHQGVKGTELQDAATKSGFEPSLVALVLFPQVVDYMASQIAWTTELGQAFTTNRSAVFDSIQRLRAQAQKVGTLKSTPQQQVETKTTSSGSNVIVIEPTNPQVVYVPQYNPTVVYTQPASTTVVVQEDNSGAAVAAGLIGFTAGIAIGAAIDNNYYYGPYGWHGGGYMYNDAWDDYYDHREDAREDWQDHREDMYEDRSDRAKNAQEQRTERTETRNENRPETQAQREQRRTDAQGAAQNRTSASSATTQSQSATTQGRTTNQESRGYSKGADSASRSGTKSDAFSGYSSGKSERAASQRGQKSRSSSRSSGGSRRR